MLTSCKRAITLSAALVCSSLAAASSSGDKIKRTVPLSAAAWTLDLRQYGYREDFGSMSQIFRLRMFHSDELFLNENELIASYVAYEPTGGLQKRSDPQHVPPFQLHALVLDPLTGQVRRQLEWPSEYVLVGLVRLDDGGFAVFLGDRVEFYSADFSHRADLDLTDRLAGEENLLWFSHSPSGKTMLIQYGDKQNPSCVWVTGESIAERDQKCPVPAEAVVSDEVVAAVTARDQGSSRVSIEKFHGPLRSLCNNGWDCRSPEFVAENVLLLWGGTAIRLINRDRKTIFGGYRGLAIGPQNVHSYVSTAHLFAFANYSYAGDKGRLAVMDIYDTSSGKRIFRVKGDRKHGVGDRLQGLAISPSGRLFALEGDGILKLYSVPLGAE